MSRFGLAIDGAFQVFDEGVWEELNPGFFGDLVEVPDEYPETVRWNGTDFEDIPMSKNADEFFALFTPTEQTTILSSGDAFAVGFFLALRYRQGSMMADDPLLVDGVAMLADNELLTVERAAQVLAFEEPI